ncbi:unnamed protein product [Lota lota]
MYRVALTQSQSAEDPFPAAVEVTYEKDTSKLMSSHVSLQTLPEAETDSTLLSRLETQVQVPPTELSSSPAEAGQETCVPIP